MDTFTPARPRRTPSIAAKWLAVALFALTATLHASDDMRIVPLVRDGDVLVSFALPDTYSTNDLRAAIQSGLRTSITYTFELRVEVPVWMDKTVASTTVTNSVEYDNLTRLHHIVRTIDGRVDEARVTHDAAAVRDFLVSFSRLPLFRTGVLQPNHEYYVLVHASARPRNTNFLWPWTGELSGQAKFTFIR